MSPFPNKNGLPQYPHSPLPDLKLPPAGPPIKIPVHPARLGAIGWDANSKVLIRALTPEITIFGSTTKIVIFLDPDSTEKLIVGNPALAFLPIQVIDEITKPDLLPTCKKFKPKTSEKACQVDMDEEVTPGLSTKICRFSTNPIPMPSDQPIITPRWLILMLVIVTRD